MRKRYGRGKDGEDDDVDDDEQQQQQHDVGLHDREADGESGVGSERKARIKKEKAALEEADGEQSEADKENVNPNRKLASTGLPAAATTASGKKRGRKPGSANKDKAGSKSERKKKPLQLQLPEEDGVAAHNKFEPDALAAYLEQVKQAGGLQQHMGMLIANHPECQHTPTQHAHAHCHHRASRRLSFAHTVIVSAPRLAGCDVCTALQSCRCITACRYRSTPAT